MAAGLARQPGAARAPGGNGNGDRSNASARPASPSMFKIDVGRQVAEIERGLRAGGDRSRDMEALAILQRWQFDEMLDDASREKARVLIREFAANSWDEVWRR